MKHKKKLSAHPTTHSFHEAVYLQVLESMAEGVSVSDENGIIVYTNPTLDTMFGYKKGELIGKHVSIQNSYPAEENRRIVNNVIKQLKTKGVWSGEFSNIKKDKTSFTTFTRITAIEIHGKRHWVSVQEDLTESKASDEKLKYQNSLLEAQQEVAPEGILIVSPNGKIISHNKQFAAMWRLPKRVLQSQLDEIALQAAQEQLINPQEFMERIAYLYKTKKKSKEKLYFKDGRIFERYGAPITAGKDTYYGYVWYFFDITERELLLKQKDDFVSIATHELKTPVTSIKAYTQVLQTRFSRQGDEKSALMLGKMDAQLNKLHSLIGDLLDATKIEAEKLQFQQDYFDSNELIHEIIEELQRTTQKHTIIPKLSRTKILYGDRERIGQVLTNLISNAIKYSPNTEKIIVKTYIHKNSLTICVQDFGVGIPKDKRNKVFERFFRLSGPKHETYPGLGLGLYISSEIIKRQGGSIWVESDAKQGSTFCFNLPLTNVDSKMT